MAEVYVPFQMNPWEPTRSFAAQGLLSLIEESEPLLQEHALRNLFIIVDQEWAEIASKVSMIEALSEDPTFAHRQLAAAVASRCFFHLEEYDDSLRLALGAGPHFDVSAPASSRSAAENQYVETMISKCIGDFKNNFEWGLEIFYYYFISYCHECYI